MLKIQFLDRRQPAFWLVDARLTIGRDKGNGLVINDEGVSVFHAELQQEDGKLYIRDAGSVNGTFLNGQAVTQRTEVHVGDVIRLHLVELQIIDPTKAPPEPPPQAVRREAPSKAVPIWQVKAMTGVISGRMFPIEGTTVVGRDPHCDIVVGGAHVSRRHAEFSVRAGQLWVRDLGSSNGSFVNSKRADEIALKNGDEVKFDAMTFKVVGPADLPQSDFEDEAERTQFRPAVNVPKPAPAPTMTSIPAIKTPMPEAPKPASPPPAPRPVTPPPVSAPEPMAPEAAPKNNAGMIIVMIVVLAIIGLFALLLS